LISIEVALLILSLLLLISIYASKISDRVGVPALLLFLVIGMLAGSDGIGGLAFTDARLAQNIGVVALAIILFSGGLDTEWNSIRPVMKEAIPLALVGVAFTAVVMGVAAYYLTDFTLLEGMLLGSIVSSTDAAAVFSILRSKGVHLKPKIRALLELESGSNDPMAVFLTIGMVQLLTLPDVTFLELVPLFIKQMGIGAIFGIVIGRLAVHIFNHIRLGYDGLYLVLGLTVVFLGYGLPGALGGSGFLSVYLIGLLLGKAEFIHRRSILRFFSGMAWLMQIALFLTLGLLVFPSQLPAIAGPGLLLSFILMFIARPASVFLTLIFSPLKLNEKTFVAWVGLRGAVPVVLATFPLLANIPQSDTIFHLVFFVVLTSVLAQGPLIPWVARLLKVDEVPRPVRTFPIEESPTGGYTNQLRELHVGANSNLAGKAIVELGLPQHFLVVLIARHDDMIIPTGGTVLEPGDTMLVLATSEAFAEVEKRIKASQH